MSVFSQIRNAVLEHVPAGDWGRYLIALGLMACVISYLSGCFIKDMSLCAAITIVYLTLAVDCDFTYWSGKGVKFWNQMRMVTDSGCIITGLFYAYYKCDNRIKME